MMPFAFNMELLWLGILLGWLRGVGHGGVFGVVALGGLNFFLWTSEYGYFLMAMLELFLLKPTIICRIWIFWCKLFVGFEYFGVNYLSDLSILVQIICRNWIC